MRLNKKLRVLSVLGIVAVASIGATIAYFTGGAQSADNVFTTGSLAVNIDQASPLSVSDVLPGEKYPIVFTVTNTGENAVFVKG